MKRPIASVAAILCSAVLLLGGVGPAAAQGSGNKKMSSPQVFELPLPYSPGFETRGKRTLYLAGQIALDDKGQLVGKGDAQAQARQVLGNIKSLLEAAGASMNDVVKITMIIPNVADYQKIGPVRREFFKEPFPASTAIVAGLLNPDWLVEIEAIAVTD